MEIKQVLLLCKPQTQSKIIEQLFQTFTTYKANTLEQKQLLEQFLDIHKILFEHIARENALKDFPAFSFFKKHSQNHPLSLELEKLFICHHIVQYKDSLLKQDNNNFSKMKYYSFSELLSTMLKSSSEKTFFEGIIEKKHLIIFEHTHPLLKEATSLVLDSLNDAQAFSKAVHFFENLGNLSDFYSSFTTPKKMHSPAIKEQLSLYYQENQKPQRKKLFIEDFKVLTLLLCVVLHS